MIKPDLKHILILIAFIFAPFISRAETNPVESKIREIEKRYNCRAGAAVLNTQTETLWSFNGSLRFPMMSTFKTLACANLLYNADSGKKDLNSKVAIEKNSIVEWSPVTEKKAGMEFTLEEACSAAMIMSDNTAANIVLENTGGPEALTFFMRSIGDQYTRLDRTEPELNEAAQGDIRDTTTPEQMVKTLNMLLFGNILSDESKRKLKDWMIKNKVADSLLRSVLPPGWYIADRSGSGGNGSRGITAVVWSDSRPPLIISIYITRSDGSFEERSKAVAEIGNEIFKFYLD